MTMLPQREQQALREVGRTAISAPLSWALVLLFLVTIASVGFLEPGLEGLHRNGSPEGEAAEETAPGLWRDFASGVVTSLRAGTSEGLITANRQLQVVMDEFEVRLEEESFLRRLVLPPLQGFLSSRLGVGNEQAYLGRADWLFYRPDVDYVTGRGFLDDDVLRARVLESDPWADPPRPDPMAALRELDAGLRSKGIHLLLLPTPVKPMLEPASFSGRFTRQSPPLQNPSFDEFCRRLEEHGIDFLDVTGDLWRYGQSSPEPLYLRTDTHWSPAAVELVAQSLSRALIALDLTQQSEEGVFFQRQTEVENLGDIARMLTPTPGQADRWRQRVLSQRVVDASGRPWKSDPQAEVLLLGDSFSNIYSDSSLGWGVGSGLAEQLSFYLQSPVDKIALNAGGALAARRALRRHWAGSSGRLDSKRVVIYQFAVRELKQGDWSLVGLD